MRLAVGLRANSQPDRIHARKRNQLCLWVVDEGMRVDRKQHTRIDMQAVVEISFDKTKTDSNAPIFYKPGTTVDYII